MKKIFMGLFVFFAFLGTTFAASKDVNQALLDEYGKDAISVTTNEEVENIIDDIYTNYKIVDYHLVFTKDNTIDIEQFKNYYQNKYMTPLDQNIYKYDQYVSYYPIKFLPTITDEEIQIDTYVMKTSKEELTKVEEFKNEFIKNFEGKSDYEKILGTYIWLRDNVEYPEENNSKEKAIDYDKSIYDALIAKKADCIGVATAFQYFMEKFNINSYIVDVVLLKDEASKSYGTVHTYNIVELDGIWYAVDISNVNNLMGLLINNSTLNPDDLSYMGINISNVSYFDTYPDAIQTFDFKFTNFPSSDITKENDYEDTKLSNIPTSIYILVLILILIIIALVILLFTKKSTKKIKKVKKSEK